MKIIIQIFLIINLLINTRSDLPVHCIAKEIKGTWHIIASENLKTFNR